MRFFFAKIVVYENIMRPTSALYLLRAQLREHGRLYAQAAFVVAFLVMALAITLAMGRGIQTTVAKARAQFPEGRLTVLPQTVTLSVLNFRVGNLTDETIAEIAALPGVEKVSPQAIVQIPLRGEIEIMGQRGESDIVLIGTDRSLVADDVAPGYSFSFDPETTDMMIPVIVPALFLDVFNMAFAESMGFPKINNKALIGRKATVHCGESSMFDGLSTPTGIPPKVCQIVGVTSAPGHVGGAYIPMEATRYLNELAGKDTTKYSTLFVRADAAHLSEVEGAVRDMGFPVESNREILDKIDFASRIVSGVVSAFAALIAAISLLCLLNLYSTLYSSRRTEMGLMYCIGAERRLVVGLAVSEILLTVVPVGLAGGGIAYFGLRFADTRLLALFPETALLPEAFLPLSLADALGLVIGVSAVCLCAALPTLLKTARATPARLLD